ncbi:MAG: hypothetical protein NVV70_12075 [Cellulomonas sp.]|nr:hypothetical protein [Cellulomonas sp.]MCR6648825.1 hypothetical protein [Cellulomonas sp.]
MNMKILCSGPCSCGEGVGLERRGEGRRAGDLDRLVGRVPRRAVGHDEDERGQCDPLRGVAHGRGEAARVHERRRPRHLQQLGELGALVAEVDVDRDRADLVRRVQRDQVLDPVVHEDRDGRLRAEAVRDERRGQSRGALLERGVRERRALRPHGDAVRHGTRHGVPDRCVVGAIEVTGRRRDVCHCSHPRGRAALGRDGC